MEIADKEEDGLFFGGNVVLFFVVDILVVDGGYHTLDANGINGLLKFKFLPQDFVLILKGDDLI